MHRATWRVPQRWFPRWPRTATRARARQALPLRRPGRQPTLGQQVQRGGHRDGRRPGRQDRRRAVPHQGHRRQGDRGAQGPDSRHGTFSTSSTDPKKGDEPDASQLLEMLFSPEDAMYMGAEVPQSYSADPDDFIGTARTRHSSSDEAVLNELLDGLADSGSASRTRNPRAGERAGRRRPHRLRLSSIFSP